MSVVIFAKAVLELLVVFACGIAILNEDKFIRFEKKAAKVIRCFFTAVYKTVIADINKKRSEHRMQKPHKVQHSAVVTPVEFSKRNDIDPNKECIA